jgi:5-methylthioadenosine/S-adenosylhomocysteine deaminase
MRSPDHVQRRWTKVARGVARLVIVPTALASLACQNGQEPTVLRPNASAATSAGVGPSSNAVILRGTIVTPTTVIKHGYVGIVDGLIVSVPDKPPEIDGAISVNTESIIAPGFVDLHNHLAWNVLPRWHPGRLYSDQPEWADSPEFKQERRPIDRLGGSSFCDMNAWAELRALVGGTTAMLATDPVPCIHGLVRNLDWNSGFYGTTELDREHLFNVSGFRFPLPSDVVGRAQFVGAAQFFIANPFYTALALHLAEGTDALAEEQFTFVRSQGLLNSKAILIHGVPLSRADFDAMAAAGTSLVWSPRSNLELYGATADIDAALDAGVTIALAPDWALTGSSNVLDELKVAARWNRDHLAGRLGDRRLLDMVTSVPARMAGVANQVGAIRPGLRADLLIVSGNENDALGAIIRADPADVQLVMIQGVPLFGERRFMERFWTRSDLEEIAFPNGSKTLASRAAGIQVSDLAARLTAALQAEGTSLAPLTEANASANAGGHFARASLLRPEPPCRSAAPFCF